MSIEAATIVSKAVVISCNLLFEYAAFNAVMRIVKEERLDLIEQHLGLNCELLVEIRQKNAS